MSFRGAAPADYLSPDDTPTDDAFSVIDRSSSFEGTFRSERDLRIEGNVKGTIDCRGTFFVAEGATVDATVEADHVTIAGEFAGEVRCRGRLQMMPSARVRGRIATQSLVINEGAIYEGQLEMTAAEPAATGRRLGNAPVPITAASEARGGGATTFIRRMGGPETAWDQRPEEAEEEAVEAKEEGREG